MKKELTTRLYKDVFDIDEVHTNVNKFIKAVIVILVMKEEILL